MDAVIQRAGQGSVEGLRQLGATAQLGSNASTASSPSVLTQYPHLHL
ncbi:MAG UNVERIFIED_CONTAM: hypothetical protein LVR29_24965 [Microcystis novacekii LVE1205-3]